MLRSAMLRRLAGLAPLPFILLALAWSGGHAARADGMEPVAPEPVLAAPRPRAAPPPRRRVVRLAHLGRGPALPPVPGCLTAEPTVPIYNVPCRTPFDE